MDFCDAYTFIQGYYWTTRMLPYSTYTLTSTYIYTHTRRHMETHLCTDYAHAYFPHIHTPPHTHTYSHTHIYSFTHTLSHKCTHYVHAYFPLMHTCHTYNPHTYTYSHTYITVSHTVSHMHTLRTCILPTHTHQPHIHTDILAHTYIQFHTHTHTYCLTHKLRILSQEQRIITSQCLLSDIPDIQCLYAFNM